MKKRIMNSLTFCLSNISGIELWEVFCEKVLQSSIRMIIIIPVCTRARSFRVLGRETGTAFRGRGSCLFLFPEFV